MNKLIQVNIGGVVFQIDEQAYHKLDAYLSALKRKYASTADGDEIVKDIEARIAELFTEKFNGTPGAIMDTDVDAIIEVMGKPEDFEGETTADQKSGAHQYERTGRASRFYRDKENNVLGGVCAGFAAKFDIDPLWIRLIFLVIFFFGGTGLILYIILWIIIPEAKTTAEKLEMHGEKVNIDNIEKSVKSGAAQFSSRINEFGEEVKQTFSKENVNKTKRNAGDFIESLVETLKPVFGVIAKVVAAFVLIISLTIIVALSVELFANWGSDFSEVEFLGNHITNGGMQAWMLVTCAIALVIIPLIGIIFSSVKYLVGIKRKTRYVSASLGILWTLCLLVVVYLGITIGREFRYEGSVTNRVEMQQPSSNTLYVQLDGNVKSLDDWDEHGNWRHMHGSNDSIVFERIHIQFEKSSDTTFSVIMTKKARGSDKFIPKKTAEDFRFEITQPADSILVIPSRIKLADGEPWRDQEVFITVRIPQDRFLKLNENIDPYLDDNEYTDDLKDLELYNTKLKMTPVGLKPVY